MEKLYKYILLLLSLAICSGIFSQTTTPQRPKDFSSMPVVKWKFKAQHPFISSPVVDGETIYAGNLDGYLYAINLKSGDLKWKFKTNGEIRSNPNVTDNTIFLISGDGNLYAIDKNTQKPMWIFKASDKQYDTNDYHQSSPILYNNVLYFGMGDGKVYAVNSTDGKEIWSYQTGDVVHSTPAILKEKLYIGSFDGNVYGFEAANGNLLWKFKTVGHSYFPKGEVQFSPTPVNITVYIAARDYNLYAIDFEKGVCRWNREFPPGWATSITHLPERDSLILLSTSDPRHLYCINRANEKTYWQANLKSQAFGKCALSENMCYTGTVMGKLFGIDVSTGEIKWVFSTEGYNKNHLKYFTSEDEYRDDIFSIIKTDKDYLDMVYSCGAIFSTSAITDNEIIFSSAEGSIYCLGR